MRLYLINPSNPLVSIVRVKESRWNRYRGAAVRRAERANIRGRVIEAYLRRAY